MFAKAYKMPRFEKKKKLRNVSLSPADLKDSVEIKASFCSHSILKATLPSQYQRVLINCSDFEMLINV